MSGTEPLIPVGIGDFHIPTLKTAAREGRLFMRARIINEEEEKGKRRPPLWHT